MKTLSAAAMGLSGARAAYKAYSNYRDRTKDKAYDALSSAAETYGPRAEDAMELARDKYDESMKKAGDVTKAARVRLEKAIAAAEEKGDSALPELRSKNKKLSRKVRRQAAKQEKKMNKDSHWVRNLALLALTASGVAALAYALMNKDKNIPGTTPPRVQDEEQTPVQEAVDGDDAAAEDEPVLVYSTETGDDAAAEVPADDAVENLASELEADAAGDADLATDAEDVAAPVTEASDAAEETPEDVDALLEDLSDAETIQAEADAVQAEFDAKNAPQREQSDKDK